MKKKMTIDGLARMTAEQFAKVDERFDKVDERFDVMDARFDKMDGTLKTILDVVLEIPSKKAFSRLETKVESIDARLTSVERKVK
ncbi:MAG: hypothetical protein A3B91_02015 [Candidatus Yanofskybacteria bacterium RIFCSPHIGHO2_02_FULL_41_29]|uniref:Uncharacterized protein n=1 Tax=Candidatus Yanofskybacteria bacterium RIFCSPHIGHO2_01_FULL_41_53 TaxID=1802663 RepID=A0A1F8EFU5_9BACT|nr:MAG: hypothetical protein A2650_01295 [Candidatus Yanofskybacteria bacterium RIFCSPHIGHO2_01_FULL_41_53]OGN10508.1 MAG: hypothetical protein A3B91_02015 [Candidatus Yanofskybacteria bacterium RIFCSPHIGHO2_02_FULL_41_29]OGN18905.1 MAG: hypothetical protein A3F48_02575 [Candidatus Yanofskybacteria bacterium RIFCSPHIGHO2_12_FULL_41_9]OGN21495.1 MAG: hypothetical protein A2916_01645 [Candidatus Yanofskybacteria bacterium RIFCSPLOWO2_01_FULL_41_67]OGN28469.1 MAG: hypothetical protein A3H54_04365 